MSDAAPPPSPTPPPSPERVELAEEVFGFNLRSVRSLTDLLIAPRKVFASIIARDRAYTPMVRLWLALLGVQIAISVIWGGYGAIAAQALQSGDPAVLAQLEAATGRTSTEFFNLYGSVMSVLHGPLVGGFTALSVLVLSRFGEKRSFGVNLNLVFAILTAGSIFGLALMPIVLAGAQTGAMSFAVTGFLTLIYALTFIRGATPSLAAGMAGRIVKGLVLSITILLLVLIGGFTANILSLIIASAWPA